LLTPTKRNIWTLQKLCFNYPFLRNIHLCLTWKQWWYSITIQLLSFKIHVTIFRKMPTANPTILKWYARLLFHSHHFLPKLRPKGVKNFINTNIKYTMKFCRKNLLVVIYWKTMHFLYLISTISTNKALWWHVYITKHVLCGLYWINWNTDYKVCSQNAIKVWQNDYLILLLFTQLYRFKQCK